MTAWQIIIKGERVSQVHGLTTAAGIWMTAAIGIAAGSGREATAVLATLLAFVVFFFVPKIPAHDEPDDANGQGHL